MAFAIRYEIQRFTHAGGGNLDDIHAAATSDV